METIKDFLEQDIHAGDWIVYPGRQGSSLDMHLAYVDSIEESCLCIISHDTWPWSKLYRARITVTKRVVVIPEEAAKNHLSYLKICECLWSPIYGLPKYPKRVGGN